MRSVLLASPLKSIKYPTSGTKKRTKEKFSLGMEEWECSSDDDDFVPLLPAKRKNTRSIKGDIKRFNEPLSVVIWRNSLRVLYQIL